MNSYYQLTPLLEAEVSPADARRSFSVFGLGVVDLLKKRIVDPRQAEFAFFNAQIISLVKQQLGEPEAMEFLERGSQLADLYDALPADAADEEYDRELETMRDLCEALWKSSEASA